MPTYVYEIEIPDPLPGEVQILDPVKEVAKILLPPAMRPSYQHDGSQEFLIGVIVLMSIRAAAFIIRSHPHENT